MLAELFLTPHAICPDFIQNVDYNKPEVLDALSLVNQLKNYLAPDFPTNLVTVCCRLGGERWSKAVAKRIMDIRHLDVRKRLEDILLRISSNKWDRYSTIPIGNLAENEWVDAAVLSSNTVPLSRIVVSNNPENYGNSPPLFSVHQIGNLDFDLNLTTARTVNNTADIRKSLASLCIHADSIILRIPYDRELNLLGGELTDLCITSRLNGLRVELPKLEIHVCSRDPNQSPILDRTLVQRLRSRFQNQGWNDDNLKVVLFPNGNFLNRIIIAQKFTMDGQHVRWRQLVAISHLPRNNDDFGMQDPNIWSVTDERVAMGILNAINNAPQGRVVRFDANGSPFDQHGNPI